MLSALRSVDGATQFDIKPTSCSSFMNLLDERDLLYKLDVVKRKQWSNESTTLSFKDLCSDAMSTIADVDILDTVAKDMPVYMVSDIVFSNIHNATSAEVMIGDKSIVCEMLDSDVVKLGIFANGGGLLMPAIADSDIRIVLKGSGASNDDTSSVDVSAVTTYVLMSKIIDTEYSHKNTLHKIPLFYQWEDYTFLYDDNTIALYNTDVLPMLLKWKKLMEVSVHPHHTVSTEHMSVEMDISSPSRVLEGLPGFNAEETNVDIKSLEKAGVYRVPIAASEQEYAEKYLLTHPNVVSYKVKELAFITPEQRDLNTKQSNAETVKLYRRLQMLIDDFGDNDVAESATSFDDTISNEVAASNAAIRAAFDVEG